MKVLIAAVTLLATGFTYSQTIHFPETPWKEKELDHFMIRTHGTGTDPARKFSEKAFEVMLEILSGLEADFEKKEFRTPRGQNAGKEDKFRFTTYLVDSGNAFHECVMTDAKRNNWPAGNVQITKTVGNHLDFEAYYQANPDAKVDARKGGSLGPEESWPKILRKLCPAGKRVSLDKTINAEIITLSPNESGSILALNYFIVSTDEHTKKYQTFITGIREGRDATKELLLETYGYADDSAFETAWYEWMMSSKFK